MSSLAQEGAPMRNRSRPYFLFSFKTSQFSKVGGNNSAKCLFFNRYVCQIWVTPKRCFFAQVKSSFTSFWFSPFIYATFYSPHPLSHSICCNAYFHTGVKNGSNQRVVQGSKTLSCCFQVVFMFIKLSQLISLFFCLPTLPNTSLVDNKIIQITEK